MTIILKVNIDGQPRIMGKINAINKLGQHHLSQIKIELDDRMMECEERISKCDTKIDKINRDVSKYKIDKINQNEYYGYVTDRIILFNLYSLPNNSFIVNVLNPYKYIVKIPGAVQFYGYIGPEAKIHKNNQLQLSIPFDIKTGDELEFALVENKFSSFTDSIASFVIKYKISKK